MTENEASQYVLEYLKVSERDMPKGRIVAHIPRALLDFSEAIAASSDRELLRKDYSISLVSGTASLTATLAASEPPLVSRWVGWVLYCSDSTYPYQPLPDRPRLLMSDPVGLGYMTLDGTTLRTKSAAAGSLTALTETATLRANYLVSLANISYQKEQAFIAVLAATVAPQTQAA